VLLPLAPAELAPLPYSTQIDLPPIVMLSGARRRSRQDVLALHDRSAANKSAAGISHSAHVGLPITLLPFETSPDFMAICAKETIISV
jgi:hypothetical protein